jgi:DNA-binding transcriptional LysR family regulator
LPAPLGLRCPHSAPRVPLSVVNERRRLVEHLDGVKVQGPLAANDVALALRAVRAGLGLALIPEALLGEEVRNGSLLVVLEDSVGADAGVSAVYADREYIEPKVRVFIDRAVAFLTARLSA